MSCCVVGCGSRKSVAFQDLTFLKFPKNPEIRSAWVKAVNRKDWEPDQDSLICSLHFESHMLDFSEYYVQLKRDAVPTKFPPPGIKFVYLKRIKEPTFQESEKPTCKHLIHQQELFNQTLYAKPLKKADSPVYPVSISKEPDESSDNLVDVLKPEIKGLQKIRKKVNKKSRKSEILCLESEDLKHKLENLQQENESLSEDNKMLRNRIHQLELSNESMRKKMKTLQQYKRRMPKQIQTLKGIINSLKENRTTDDYLQTERLYLPKNKSDKKIEKRDLCHPEEFVVIGHIVLPEADTKNTTEPPEISNISPTKDFINLGYCL